jgi:hypothetical protein
MLPALGGTIGRACPISNHKREGEREREREREGERERGRER